MDEFETSKTSGLAGEGAFAAGRRLPRIDEAQGAEDVFATLTEPLLDDDAFESTSDDSAPVWPDRKYSFNALIAVGIAGFVVGRLFSR